MLKSIKLENFRAFSEEIYVRIRPITILIGANSAGKSTLIKFFLMLQQTLETSEDAFLVTEGRHVHLGTFQNLKNSNYASRSLKFELQLETSDLPPITIQKLREQIRKSKLVKEPGSDRTELKINIDRLDTRKNNELALFNISASVKYGKVPNRGRHSVCGEIEGKKIFKAESRNLRRAGFLSFPSESDNPKDLLNTSLDDIFLQGLRHEIRSFQHLSPIREESERAILLASPPPNDVGHMGEFAMPHLERILAEDGEKAIFVKKHIEAVAEIEDLKFESSMHYIEVEPPDNLRKFVRQIINDSTKRVDRYLVETAALSDCDLVTNDDTDILSNSQMLKKELKRMKGVKCKNIRFMSSQDAWSEFCWIA
jgi:hypothetical protein